MTVALLDIDEDQAEKIAEAIINRCPAEISKLDTHRHVETNWRCIKKTNHHPPMHETVLPAPVGRIVWEEPYE